MFHSKTYLSHMILAAGGLQCSPGNLKEGFLLAPVEKAKEFLLLPGNRQQVNCPGAPPALPSQPEQTFGGSPGSDPGFTHGSTDGPRLPSRCRPKASPEADEG